MFEYLCSTSYPTGFDINVLSTTNITFYIINHRPFGSVIEKFWHNPEEDHLTFIKTIPIPFSSAGGAPSPNDIFALPESDDKNAFFVTNDHQFKEGFLRTIEDVARLPLGHLSYFSDDEGWKIVAKNLAYANGLTGTKKVTAIDGDQAPTNTLYVSCLGAGLIRAFSRSYGSPQVYPVQDILLDAGADNPSLSYPSQSQLLVAAYPEPLVVQQYVFGPEEERPACPVVVYSFSTSQVGSTFYGKGYTGEVAVETVYADQKGLLGNATSTAVLVESKEGGKGDLYLTGLLMEGITRCRNFM